MFRLVMERCYHLRSRDIIRGQVSSKIVPDKFIMYFYFWIPIYVIRYYSGDRQYYFDDLSSSVFFLYFYNSIDEGIVSSEYSRGAIFCLPTTRATGRTNLGTMVPKRAMHSSLLQLYSPPLRNYHRRKGIRQ